ncbi:hypothetical protein C8A05DRAFT_35026 [Staphylotrichum tortipilum]|uniref:LysM domain-containing protein n=1 Tax=Staphylotrichum tortipilum TaxID=2831512 RepID=A0AAN6MI55_9PEZI|nr:hypothetical protein C8A05DRAFT_35026 [Staphylotrichum longicolle]
MPNATPKQEGMAAECAKLWLVGPDDTCESIETANGITETQFLQWNPAVGTTACTNLVRDFYHQHHDGSKHLNINHTRAVNLHHHSGDEHNHLRWKRPRHCAHTHGCGFENMTTSCRRFYFAQSGDGCWAIANSAGINLTNFYAWNPAVGEL